MAKLVDIIHEDAELLVVNKPAGLVCHPTKGDVYSSLISRVRLHLDTARRSRNQRSADRRVRALLSPCLEHADPAVRAPGKSSPPATMLGDSTAAAGLHLVNRLDRE